MASAARAIEWALVLLGLTACSGLFSRSPAPPGPGETKADQVAPAPAADRARVYLVVGELRNGPLVTAVRDAQWQINDRPVGRANTKEMLVADLPAGGYRFAWRAPWLPQDGKGITREQLDLMLAAGQTLTLRANLVQVAGLTSDDYRLSVAVADQGRAAAAARDLTPRAADTNGLVGTPFDASAVAQAPAAPAPGAAQTPQTPAPAGATRPPASAAPASDAAAQCRRPVADRLRELDSLQQQGLITPEEYARKRQAILDCV